MSYIIEHKHTIGDDIKFLYDNKVTEGKVDAVQIFVNKEWTPNGVTVASCSISITKINYSIAFKHPTLQTNKKINLSEVNVFTTKKELLDSL